MDITHTFIRNNFDVLAVAFRALGLVVLLFNILPKQVIELKHKEDGLLITKVLLFCMSIAGIMMGIIPLVFVFVTYPNFLDVHFLIDSIIFFMASLSFYLMYNLRK